MKTTWLTAILLGGACLAWASLAVAQDPEGPVGDVPAVEAPAAEKPADAKSAAADGLVTRQQQVADKFIELERLLLRMAELTAPTDPRRAKLLRQAVAQSKERAIDQQFEELVALLRQERLSSVVKNQGEVQGELVKLLELLLSEDRSKRLETEKERVREYLKRVNKLIKEQKSVQNATERDADGRELADRQGELSQETKKLADEVRKNEQPKSPSDESKSDGKQSDPKDAEPKDSEPKDAEDKPQDGDQDKPESKEPKKDEEEKKDADSEKQDPEKKDSEKPEPEKESGDKEKSEGDDAKKSDGDKKSDSESKPGEKSPGEPQEGKPQESEPKESQSPPNSGKPSESSPSEPAEQNPTQQRLEKAQQRMEEAQKKLEEAKKSDAVEKQEEAIRELEQAKAELEEILRQLREEEMARTLAMLEARFRKMLDAQVQIYEGTQRLDKVPEAERDRDDAIEAGRLSQKEAEIALEADKALNVLQEEGSAVAFPEAVMEIRDDMITVRDRLAEAKIGEMTQGVEKDIIAALEEMITALEKAQQEMQDKSQSPPPGEGGEGEMPLVDAIAELKMIRALQMRVNTRTQRYAEVSKTEQVDQPELLDSLRKLAEREERIHKVTRDIVLGRNR
jgi:hypothetical protein